MVKYITLSDYCALNTQQGVQGALQVLLLLLLLLTAAMSAVSAPVFRCYFKLYFLCLAAKPKPFSGYLSWYETYLVLCPSAENVHSR